MSALAHRHETESTASSVLQFPRFVDEPSETEAFSSNSSDSREFFEQLRAAFDAYVTENYVKQLRFGNGVAESPFDAVYISALMPDEVEPQAVSRISEFAGIVDLSDSLEFADEWGD